MTNITLLYSYGLIYNLFLIRILVVIGKGLQESLYQQESGYMLNAYSFYLFYKDENNPLSYQVIKYDISTKEWLINGYQEWRVHSTEDKGW